jgi:hypothetical protein
VTAVETDWDCALATAEYPKTCLYSFDAEEGSKVVAPIGTTQWITLAALNRLRRNDPTKVEPLWHSQYKILNTWWHASPYTFYQHLSAPGTLLAAVLDAPLILAAAMAGTVGLVFAITFPIWEAVVKMVLTSPALWKQWPAWGRFVHAALPLKLLLGQMAFKMLAEAGGSLYHMIRSVLVEWECAMLEECLPLTILEGEEETEEVGEIDEVKEGKDEDDGEDDYDEDES